MSLLPGFVDLVTAVQATLLLEIEKLMNASSFEDADHDLEGVKARPGGGPLNSIESTYKGFGFLVDLTDLRLKFSAMTLDGVISASCGVKSV